MKYPPWYGILVGILMMAQWTVSVATNSVPEFETTPWAIGFHLAAEVITVLMLFIGGIATLKSTKWGRQVLLVGVGMVIYSEIASPGYLPNKVNGRWWSYLPFYFSARSLRSCQC